MRSYKSDSGLTMAGDKVTRENHEHRSEDHSNEAAPGHLGTFRCWLLGSLTLLVLGTAVLIGCTHRSRPGETTAPAAHVLSPAPVQIVPGIYLLGGLAPAAAYVVETSAGLVLVDTGLQADGRLLRAEMAKLHLDWHDIRAIFLTHVHGDHTGGAAQLRAATGAKVYAGRQDAAVLRAGKPWEAFFSKFSMPSEIKPVPTPVDVDLNGDDIIHVGDVQFQALATPGHTPGSTCYVMERNGQRILFSGDVIWSLSADGPLGIYSAYLPPRYRGNAREFLATLRRLRALPVPDLVLPGHPRKDLVPESPAMTAERWARLLDPGIRALERLEARYQRDGANFLDGQPKQLLRGLYYLGDYHDGAVYALKAQSRLFVVNAPGGPGLADFVTTRLQALGVKPTAVTAVILTSGDRDDTAGLPDLLERAHRKTVVVPAASHDAAAAFPGGTDIISAADLHAKGWFPVQALALAGRGTAPLAYLVRWEGKAVLLTGRIPINRSHATVAALEADFRHNDGDVAAYRASLRQLNDVNPDLWLPAHPADGQNANLYDRAWESILSDNAELFR